MTALGTETYKGSRDWYPDDTRLRDYILSTWRKVARSYGYEAYDAPLLEPIDIYAKSGQEISNEQTFKFVDSTGRQLVIRPEMTPSTSRMVAAKQQNLAMPARWYTIGQFMRHERTVRGREREFWQMNCDIFGLDGALAEAEIICLSNDILKALGATEEMYQIRINSRAVVNVMMAHFLGLDAVQSQLMIRLFDKKSRISPESFRDQAIEIFGQSAAKEGLRKLAHVLAAKTMADLPEQIRDSGAVKDVQELFTVLARDGVTNAMFDITLMRGLDYYTGTVFEYYDRHTDNKRALFGGGRYDGLVSLFGGEPVGAVGIGLGLSSTQLFLEAHHLAPQLASTTDLYVVVLDSALKGVQSLARQFRHEGLNLEVDMTNRPIDKQIKTAIRKNIPYLLFVGKEELDKEMYTLKVVKTSAEHKLSFERVVTFIKDKRRTHSRDDDDFAFDELV